MAIVKRETESIKTNNHIIKETLSDGSETYAVLILLPDDNVASVECINADAAYELSDLLDDKEKFFIEY